jgi:DNA-binding response OmpR family regulator
MLKAVIISVAEDRMHYNGSLVKQLKITLMQPEEARWGCAGNLVVNLDTKTVRIGGILIGLSPQEFEVLTLLVNRQGRPVDAPTLLERVWCTTLSTGGTRDQVWSCMRRLRRKIEIIDKAYSDCIHFVQGQGYVLRVAGFSEPSLGPRAT